ncbi:MAG: PP2C family protein-serine/threonine phosphatase, partial [Flavobacteriales bacterium]|nr:PP2C family protein-serine/threonine phosphatase [Flavobacteriales bacterium]
ILINQLHIGKAKLLIHDGTQWDRVLSYGSDSDSGKISINIDNDLIPLKEITVVESTSKPIYGYFDVVIPILHKDRPLAYLMVGDLDGDELKISPIIKHLPFIQTLANIITVAIENKRLARESIAQERLKRELELASEMQNLLFPGKLPDNEHLQIAAFYQPHQSVGGDYYDFIDLNEREIMFCVADVSGKGVSAAILMANFQANLRAMASYNPPLKDMVISLNKKVNENAKGEKFITLFIAKYNKETRVLNFINAAHNPPVYFNAEQTELLSVGCTGLGMFDEIPRIEEGSIFIEKESIITCYTDGVVEQENHENEAFELERLEQLISENKDSTMSELNDVITRRLLKFKGEVPYIDDIALFSCRFH